jgi:hypothetical protein
LALMGMAWDAPILALVLTFLITMFAFGIIGYQWFYVLNRHD